jgi:RNA polymerase sigma factor (sigma-70 family)
VSGAAIDPLVSPCRRPGPGEAAEPGDHELLERFAARGDEAAFAALVRRHGPMVRGLCRRLLGDPGRAEDVFQATFLVLARRASHIRKRQSVGSFLYGVARRLGCNARRGEARRRRHERRAAQCRPRPRSPEAGWAELLATLDEELARLPEQARAPLLLCYLEGRTQDEAARFLGWSLGTLRRRLERGRDLLRLRLTGRGATLSAALFAALLAPHGATAAVPECLAETTARAAFEFAVGRAPAGAAATLARTALSSPAPRLLKTLALFALTLGAVTVAAVGRPAPPSDERPADPHPLAPRAPEGKPAAGPAGGDRLGDPLPEGALVRFGSTRFRHPGGIESAALAPGGKVLATAGAHTLRLIDTTTGRALLTLPAPDLPEGHVDGVRELAISPDGKGLLVAGTEGAHLLDAATGRETRRLATRWKGFRGVAFSPDGRQIAVTEGGGATFYDAATGARQHRIEPAGKEPSWWLAYAPDGRLVALAGETEATVRLCDPATGREVRRFSNGSEVLAAAFAPDGKVLAAAGKDHIVHLWDIAAGKEVHALAHALAEAPAPPGERLSALAFAPDGRVLAVGTSEHIIHLWDPAAGKPLGRLEGHTWMVTGLAFAAGGKTLYSTSWDGTVRRWDVAAGKEIRGKEIDFEQTQMARSPDGKLLATGGADGTITLWEAATGRKLRLLEGHRRGIFALAFSPDGRRLASGGWERIVRVHDVAGGREERALDCGPGPAGQGRVEAAAFSPDGRLLAACDSGRHQTHLWDAGTGKPLRDFPHKDGPVSLAFAPDCKSLAIGGWDSKLVLWDAATGRRLRTIQPEGAPACVDAVAFSPDGRLIATGHHFAPVFLWDAATGKQVRQIKAEHKITWCLAFSPDGRWLATGGLDGTAALWEVATGGRLHTLRGHAFWVLRLAFGPDGRTLATGGYDGTSLLWTLKPKLEALPPAGVLPLWEALLDADGAGAYRAAWTLAEHPDETIAFLREHLRAGKPAVDGDRVRRRLADLDSGEFEKREAASRELAGLGAAVEPEVRAALAKAPSPEARRRLEALLEGMKPELSPEVLRQDRAVRVLELIGTPEALRLRDRVVGR